MRVFRLPGEQVAPDHLWIFTGISTQKGYVERVYLGSELQWMQHYWQENEQSSPQFALSLLALIDLQKALLGLPLIQTSSENVHNSQSEFLCGWKGGEKAARFLAPSVEKALEAAFLMDQALCATPAHPEFCFERGHVDYWTRKLYGAITHPEWDGVDEDLRYLNASLDSYCHTRLCA